MANQDKNAKDTLAVEQVIIYLMNKSKLWSENKSLTVTIMPKKDHIITADVSQSDLIIAHCSGKQVAFFLINCESCIPPL